MSELEHKFLVAAYYAALATTDEAALAALVDAGFRYHVGHHAFDLLTLDCMLRSYREGFSDFSIAIDRVVVQGDLAAVRTIATGCHTGTFLSHAPTGRRFSAVGS